jgi:hypothetical protein
MSRQIAGSVKLIDLERVKQVECCGKELESVVEVNLRVRFSFLAQRAEEDLHSLPIMIRVTCACEVKNI